MGGKGGLVLMWPTFWMPLRLSTRLLHVNLVRAGTSTCAKTHGCYKNAVTFNYRGVFVVFVGCGIPFMQFYHIVFSLPIAEHGIMSS